MSQPFNWRTDAFRSYETAIAAKREQAIRSGKIDPLTPTEHRWAREGVVPVSQMDAATNPATDAGEQA